MKQITLVTYLFCTVLLFYQISCMIKRGIDISLNYASFRSLLWIICEWLSLGCLGARLDSGPRRRDSRAPPLPTWTWSTRIARPTHVSDSAWLSLSNSSSHLAGFRWHLAESERPQSCASFEYDLLDPNPPEKQNHPIVSLFRQIQILAKY